MTKTEYPQGSKIILLANKILFSRAVNPDKKGTQGVKWPLLDTSIIW